MLRVHDKERYRKIADEAFGLAKGRALEITIREQSGFLTRFANNEIHQNGFREFLKISLRMIAKGKSARVETTDPSRASLVSCVERLKALLQSRRGSDHEPGQAARQPQSEQGAEGASGELGQAARQCRPDQAAEAGWSGGGRPLAHPAPRDRRGGGQDEPALLSKQSYRAVNDFDPKIASGNPDHSARDIAEAVREIKKNGAEASGYDSAVCRHVYIANSNGLEAWHRSSAFRFGLTARKGQGVGYASGFSAFQKEINKQEIFKTALQRAGQAVLPVRVKPGRYTVIFSPRAMAEFTVPLFEDMNARKVADKNSFFWGKKGKRIFSKILTVEDNVYFPGQTGLPFDGVGLPRKKVLLVDKGVVRNFVNDRKAALDFRQAPTGHGAGSLQPSTMPVNLVVRNGEEKWADLLERLDHAIFIPHIWYHQVTNANTLLATGLIKGSALVWRNGAWQGGIQHVRYSQSLVEVLHRIIDVSCDKEMIKDKEHGGSLWPFTVVEGFRIV